MRPSTADEEDDPPNARALQPPRPGFQPKGTHDAEFVGELANHERSNEARRLERLADQEMVLTLQLHEFGTGSPEWKAFASALAEYGYSVFMGWLITGSVYRMAASQMKGKGVMGLGKIPDDLRLVGDDAHALASEVVIKSIDAFRRKTLMNPDPAKRWKVNGGASIKTFFIGRCLMELPDVFEQWNRRERRVQAELWRNSQLTGEDVNHSIDPENPAVATAELDRVFKRADTVIRVMFELHHEGYTYAEIAEMLTDAGHDTTVAQVRTNMSRFRNAARVSA